MPTCPSPREQLTLPYNISDDVSTHYTVADLAWFPVDLGPHGSNGRQSTFHLPQVSLSAPFCLFSPGLDLGVVYLTSHEISEDQTSKSKLDIPGQWREMGLT